MTPASRHRRAAAGRRRRSAPDPVHATARTNSTSLLRSVSGRQDCVRPERSVPRECGQAGSPREQSSHSPEEECPDRHHQHTPRRPPPDRRIPGCHRPHRSDDCSPPPGRQSRREGDHDEDRHDQQESARHHGVEDLSFGWRRHGMIPASRPAAPYHSANVSTVSWALRPLGLGTTHTAAPFHSTGCRPIAAFLARKASR